MNLYVVSFGGRCHTDGAGYVIQKIFDSEEKATKYLAETNQPGCWWNNTTIEVFELNGNRLDNINVNTEVTRRSELIFKIKKLKNELIDIEHYGCTTSDESKYRDKLRNIIELLES